MKRYQLIGRKKAINRIPTPNYPTLHLHSLPLEILLNIFDSFADNVPQLLRLCLVCQKFRSIINKYFLYRAIKFDESNSFTKFCQFHLPNSTLKRLGMSETSATVNLVQEFIYVNPPREESDLYNTRIAGTYSVEGVRNPHIITFSDFLVGLSMLVKEDFNLKAVTLSEISPAFAFPPIQPDSFLKKNKPRRKLEKLVLKAESGWSIPFKLTHISLFLNTYDTITTLELVNFTIDEVKLAQIKSSKTVTIENLALFSCTLVNRMQKRESCELFAATRRLQLDSIAHRNDLSIIDFIKQNSKLAILSIDIGSPFFYDQDKFNFASYNPFFRLLCSKQGSYANIKRLTLKNCDFIFNCSHNVESSENDPLAEFLGHLSSLDEVVFIIRKISMTIKTCKNCGFVKHEDIRGFHTLSRGDWMALLKPMKAARHIKVLNYRNAVLFEKTENQYFD